ncbi:acyl-[acyl-carrier-protein] thioesterase [Oleiharenicola lentus]|uniref:acyl-[acyl-carrier-protein] thioesterase n=1 Tax=Oleiharenicola lentus TaxID=2508720 RepID=UPI003F665BD7
MSSEFILPAVVSYREVDRDQLMTLGSVFQLLQEAAIKHADLFGLGTKAMEARQESWVLNRIAAKIIRYPGYEENVRVVTWSAGIRGFRGYRDLRVFSGEELLVTASTLWLYLNLQTKTLTRVPLALAEQFPVGETEVFRPDLEKLRFTPPGDMTQSHEVSLRYSDFDGNRHMNNTAYFDCLQTALVRAGQPPRPAGIEMQFLKEVLPAQESVRVALETRGQEVAFGIASSSELHAQGAVTF